VKYLAAMADHSMPMINMPNTAVLRRFAINPGKWRMCNIIGQGRAESVPTSMPAYDFARLNPRGNHNFLG
jgi:hypothetical protein